MAFRTGAYAYIWNYKPNANYTDAQISTRHKKKGTEEYETDFSGFVRFIGTAHSDIISALGQNPKEADTNPATGKRQAIMRIKLGDVATTQIWSPQYKKSFVNFQVFSYERPDDIGDAAPAQQTYTPPKFDPSIPENVIEETLPFS